MIPFSTQVIPQPVNILRILIFVAIFSGVLVMTFIARTYLWIQETESEGGR